MQVLRNSRLLTHIGILWSLSTLAAMAERASIPGKTVPIYDSYVENARTVNPLYLNTLLKKPWLHENADARVPILVTETIGMERRNAPVSVLIDLPPNVPQTSPRVVTPFGEAITSQVKVVDQAHSRVEVVFLLDMMKFEQVPLFIYYGAKEIPVLSPGDPTAMSVRDGRDFYHLENERIRVWLDKADGTVRALRSVQGSGKNLLGEFFPYCGGDGNVGCPGGQAEITEDGPVRKTLIFRHPAMTTEFSVYSSSPALHFRMIPPAPQALGSLVIWAPYGDRLRDSLVYETEQGLRQCKIQYASDEDLKDFIIPDVKEGWLALEDERGEVGGEIYEIAGSVPPGIYQHGTGYRLSRHRGAAAEHRGALVAAAGNYETVRNFYLSWKNPPLVTLGQPQGKVDIRPRVPVFGQDFIRTHYSCYGAWSFTRVNEHSARELVTEVQRLGANYLGFYSYRPFWALGSDTLPEPGKEQKEDPFVTKELIPTAHAMGVGIQAGLSVGGCPIQQRDIFTRNAKAVAVTGVDMLSLLDEYGFSLWSDPAKEAFRKEFGMEPPEEDYFDQPEKFQQEVYRNLCLFRIRVINELVKDMAQAAKAANPKVTVFHVTSPNNMILTRSGYHDLETQSEFVDFPNTDLYSANLDFVLYYTKYLRGAWGNNRPILTVYSIYTSGGASNSAETQLEIYLQLMWGSNALWGFSMVGRRWEGDHVLLGAKAAYDLLNYSGLEDFVAQARPMKFVGVLRDRDAFMHGIKQGEAGAGGAYEHWLIAPLVSALKAMPVDIVFSKYLGSLRSDGYRALIIPDDPVLSPANAAHIKTYVENGGNVIVEANGIRNPVIQEMAKVAPIADAKDQTDAWEIKGAAAPLQDLKLTLRARKTPITNHGAEALAALPDGSPAFTRAKFGKGSVIYTPFVLSSSANRVAEVNQVLRKLILDIAGPMPLAASPEVVATNILVNDARKAMILAAYNDSRETVAAELKLSREAISLPEKVEVVELTEGQKIEFSGDVIKDSLQPWQVKFFLLSPEGATPVPETGALVAQGLAFSSQSGMKFLKLKPEEPAAKSKEREKDPNKIYVGIFKGSKTGSLCDWGTEAIYEEAKALRQVEAEYIEDVTERETGFYDVIIMPNRLSGSMPHNEAWPDVLREFVEKGGGALMVHHAIGRNPPFPAVFPEIGTCGQLCVPLTSMQVVKEHPVTTGSSFRKRFPELEQNPAFVVQMRATQFGKGDVFEDGFPDYFAVVPAENSEVLVRSVYDKAKDQGDDATVVVGKLGKGKVVLSAMGIGCLGKKVDGQFRGEEKCTEGEKKLLVNSIYWLAEKE